jgi:hypothetical protein
MNVALQTLAKEPSDLAATSSRPTVDVVVAYALAAYLIEGRSTAVPVVLKSVGEWHGLRRSAADRARVVGPRAPGSPPPMAQGTDMIFPSGSLVRIAAGLVLSGLVLAGSGAAQDGIEVTWKGKPFDTGTPPAELPESARGAVTEWKAWVKHSGYKMALDNDARFS